MAGDRAATAAGHVELCARIVEKLTGDVERNGRPVASRALDDLAGRGAWQINPHGGAIGDDAVARRIREAYGKPVRPLLLEITTGIGARASQRVGHRLLECGARGLHFRPRGHGTIERVVARLRGKRRRDGDEHNE